MRVSNLTIQKTLLSDLHTNLSRMLEMQTQMASGKLHSRPSDAPADVAREMSLETSLVENVQYTRNLDAAQAWLANTDTAFDQMTSVVQRIRELTIYAGDGALEDAEVDAIATEISELQEEMRNIANYSVEGRYLLGGTKVCQQPFYRDASGKVCYRGGDFVGTLLGFQHGNESGGVQYDLAHSPLSSRRLARNASTDASGFPSVYCFAKA